MAVLTECRICHGCVMYGCAYRVQGMLRLCLSSAGYITAVLGTAVLTECRTYHGCVRYGWAHRVQDMLRLC